MNSYLYLNGPPGKYKIVVDGKKYKYSIYNYKMVFFEIECKEFSIQIFCEDKYNQTFKINEDLVRYIILNYKKLCPFENEQPDEPTYFLIFDQENMDIYQTYYQNILRKKKLKRLLDD